MFDLGWGEMMVVGVVALVVVGPKELPTLFRTVGKAVGRVQGMARDFQRAMEEAADETGVKDLARDINKDVKEATKDPLGLDEASKKIKEANDRAAKIAKDAYDMEGELEFPKPVDAVKPNSSSKASETSQPLDAPEATANKKTVGKKTDAPAESKATESSSKPSDKG